MGASIVNILTTSDIPEMIGCFKLKLQAYQFLNQKKKKRSGRAMTENWNLVKLIFDKVFQRTSWSTDFPRWVARLAARR